MSRAFILDRWVKKDRTPSARHGVGSRWQVQWDETAPGPGNTPVKRRRKKDFARKVDAQTYADELNSSIRSGTYRPPEAGNTPFRDAAERWISTRMDVKGSTLHRYRRELDTYVLPQFGHLTVGHISRADVEGWVSALAKGTAPVAYLNRDTGERVRGTLKQPLAPTMVKHVHTVASAVLTWAVDNNMIPSNPAARVKRPRITAADPVYLDHRELDALARAAEGVTGSDTDRVLVLFLGYVGARIGEATALRVSDVDLPARRAFIRATWTRDPDGKRALGAPKTHERRAVPLTGFLVDELRALTAGQAADGFVFRAQRGGAIDDHNWRIRVFGPAAADAGLAHRGLTPHKLRHTAASAAIAAGADVMVVKQMLGHADAKQTLNTYSHLWPDRLDEVADAMEQARTRHLQLVPVPGEVPQKCPTPILGGESETA